MLLNWQTENVCTNINGLDLILFSWTAYNAYAYIDGNWPAKYYHGQKPPLHSSSVNVFCNKSNIVPILEITKLSSGNTHFIGNFK